jgi:hypothetical protein
MASSFNRSALAIPQDEKPNCSAVSLINRVFLPFIIILEIEVFF